jgi:FtsP/CotA-like multicopper oxidase with cupredoxin domain
MKEFYKLHNLLYRRRNVLRFGLGLFAGIFSSQFSHRKVEASPWDTKLLSSSNQSNRVTLTLKEVTINVNGKESLVTTIEGPNGELGYSPNLQDGFHVKVVNQLKVPSCIHWHGLILPWAMDGVPFVSQNPIPAGGSYDYDFPLVHSGTNWMHSHYGLQEQYLLAAPLVIWSPEELAIAEQQFVIELADFSFTPAQKILENLKAGQMGDPSSSSMMNMNMNMGATPAKTVEVVTQQWDSVNQRFFKKTVQGEIPEYDVSYDALLANRKTIDNPEIFNVQGGKSVLLRIIAASSMTNFFIDTGKLEATVMAVDGNAVIPVKGDFFELSNAQRIDLRVTIPKNGGAFPIIAQGEGTNLICGVVLATQGALIPKLPTIAPLKTASLNSLQDTYLKAKNPLAKRPVDRKFDIVLDGIMTGYQWTINGSSYPNRKFLGVKTGQRVAMRFQNKNKMGHPMHLHGHVFQVVEVGGVPISGPVRDTVFVPPLSDVVIEFDATNPGIWAMHCHLLYHATNGMFTILKYEGANTKYWQPEQLEKEILSL